MKWSLNCSLWGGWTESHQCLNQNTFQGQEARTITSASHAVPHSYWWCCLLSQPPHCSHLEHQGFHWPHPTGSTVTLAMSASPSKGPPLFLYSTQKEGAPLESFILQYCLQLLETLNMTPVLLARESSALPALAWESTARDTRQGGSCGAVLSTLHSMVILGEREKHLLGTIISFTSKAASSNFLNISEHFGHWHKLAPA